DPRAERCAGEECSGTDDGKTGHDQRRGGNQLAPPDRRRWNGLRKVKGQTAIRQLASDDRRAKDRAETDREIDRQTEGRNGQRGGTLARLNSWHERHDERQDQKRGGGHKHESFFRQLATGNHHSDVHDWSPSSPEIAMKMSSRESGAISVRTSGSAANRMRR